MSSFLFALLLGFILDLLLGDPHTPLHPVALIGRMILALEAVIYPRKEGDRGNTGKSGNTVSRNSFEKISLMIRGGILVVITTGLTAIVVYGILRLTKALDLPILFLIIEAVICWLALAAKSLKAESMKVGEALDRGDLIEARRALSMIVGRDTDSLTEEEIIRATVESVAESSCDGVIAPMTYLIIGGPVLGFIYKAVNTLDSMVGYRNERYEYFGKVAARLDDVFNFLPSRIAAILMIVCAFFHREADGKNAFAVWRKDRYKHDSPNAGQTEAVAAGALGITLGGDASYGGFLRHRPVFMAEGGREPEVRDIRRMNDLMYGGSFLFLFIAAVGCLIRSVI